VQATLEPGTGETEGRGICPAEALQRCGYFSRILKRTSSFRGKARITSEKRRRRSRQAIGVYGRELVACRRQSSAIAAARAEAAGTDSAHRLSAVRFP